jgi:hypothetical protein
MAVVIKEYNGSGPTATTITHLKHRTYDDYVNDATRPIPKPSSGTNYAYWKTVALYADAGADIYSDIKVYGGGDPTWTGVVLSIGDETSDTYDEATGVADSSGDEMVAGHSEVTAKTNFWTTYTSLNMKTVGLIGGVTSLGPLGSPQRVSKYIFFQAAVGTTVSAGSLANGTIYIRYSITS